MTARAASLPKASTDQSLTIKQRAPPQRDNAVQMRRKLWTALLSLHPRRLQEITPTMLQTLRDEMQSPSSLVVDRVTRAGYACTSLPYGVQVSGVRDKRSLLASQECLGANLCSELLGTVFSVPSKTALFWDLEISESSSLPQMCVDQHTSGSSSPLASRSCHLLGRGAAYHRELDSFFF